MLYHIVILNCAISYILMTYAHNKNKDLFNDTYYHITKILVVINLILAIYVYVTK